MNPCREPASALAAKFPARPGVFRLLVNADCGLHDPHATPETPARLTACLRGLLSLPAETPVGTFAPPAAAWGDLRGVHDPGYVSALESCLHGGRPYFMHPDCAAGYGSDEAILAAAGLAQSLGDTLAEGGSGFALTRPPGHHAGRSKAEGFCFVNHAALAVRRIRKKHPQARIAVVDIDLHHGNGTQDCLSGEPGLFLLSLHAHPLFLYPGSGFSEENRDAPAIVRNIPLHEGIRGPEWLAALESGLAELEKFAPEYLIVALGLDGHDEDPNRFFHLTDEDFLSAAKRLHGVAEAFSVGRIGVLLEGGYSVFVLERLLPKLVETFSGVKSGACVAP